jgi:hypothetical protein
MLAALGDMIARAQEFDIAVSAVCAQGRAGRNKIIGYLLR